MVASLIGMCLMVFQPAGDGVVRLPLIEVDTHKREVRVQAEALAVDMPLEFLCVTRGGPEHESVLRTSAKPSDVHAGLLMLGLEPGQGVRFSEAKRAWLAPFGPPVRIELEWTIDDQTTRIPAEQSMRRIRDKTPMPAATWIFAGSKVDERGNYLADLAGYMVSIVNFEFTPIDVPGLVSSDNATLEWQYNFDLAPPAGTPVTMILIPVQGAPAAEPEKAPGEPDDRELKLLRDQWRVAVQPHAGALKQAAQTHYEVILELRRRQQALIDQADELQRLIDELEKEYAQMTTPRPARD
jgi:hypothetical protein